MFIIGTYVSKYCLSFYWLPITFNKTTAFCDNLPIEVKDNVITNIAFDVQRVIFCLNRGVFSVSKIASPKHNYTILIFSDRAILIKNPAECARQQYDFHLFSFKSGRFH